MSSYIKNKSILLLLLSILLAIIAYSFNFSKTIKLYYSITEIENKIDKVVADSILVANGVEQITKSIGKQKGSSFDIISFTNQHVGRTLELYMLTPGYKTSSENIDFQTYELTLSGNYIDMVLFVNAFRKAMPHNKIMSVRIENLKTDDSNLVQTFLTITFKNAYLNLN